MKRIMVAALLAVLAAGCAQRSIERPLGEGDACNAAAFVSLVGKSESEIPKSSLPTSHRIVCSDCAVTMEFSPQRLTIQLDEEGRVATVRCG